MPLPGWFVNQAHEEWLEEKQSFKEWLILAEQQHHQHQQYQYVEEENYNISKSKNVRPKRYYVKQNNYKK